MAMIKRRIMTRSRLLSLMHGDIDQRDEPKDYPSMKAISADMAAHLLADDREVKIFHDVNLGGTVVEYDDGT